jgi:hypothetical protein
MGASRGAYNVLVGKSEGRRPLGIPRHRWENNTKMDLRVKWGMDRIDLSQDRDRWQALVNVVMILRVPQNAGNFLSS